MTQVVRIEYALGWSAAGRGCAGRAEDGTGGAAPGRAVEGTGGGATAR